MASEPQFVRIPRSPSVRLGRDRALTADAATDRLTLTAHGLAAGDELRLVAGTAPGGLALNTTYFVVNPTANDFQLAATLGGAPLDLSSNGSGLVARVHNSRLDGTGHTELLIAAPSGSGAAGLRIDAVRVQAAGPTTTGMVRLFKAEGATLRLLHELAVVAATPSAAVRAFSADVQFAGGLLLEPGQALRAAPHQPELFDLTVLQGGEF